MASFEDELRQTVRENIADMLCFTYRFEADFTMPDHMYPVASFEEEIKKELISFFKSFDFNVYQLSFSYDLPTLRVKVSGKLSSGISYPDFKTYAKFVVMEELRNYLESLCRYDLFTLSLEPIEDEIEVPLEIEDTDIISSQYRYFHTLLFAHSGTISPALLINPNLHEVGTLNYFGEETLISLHFIHPNELTLRTLEVVVAHYLLPGKTLSINLYGKEKELDVKNISSYRQLNFEGVKFVYHQYPSETKLSAALDQTIKLNPHGTHIFYLSEVGGGLTSYQITLEYIHDVLLHNPGFYTSKAYFLASPFVAIKRVEKLCKSDLDGYEIIDYGSLSKREKAASLMRGFYRRVVSISELFNCIPQSLHSLDLFALRDETINDDVFTYCTSSVMDNFDLTLSEVAYPDLIGDLLFGSSTRVRLDIFPLVAGEYLPMILSDDETGFDIHNHYKFFVTSYFEDELNLTILARYIHTIWRVKKTCMHYNLGKYRDNEQKITPYLVDFDQLRDSFIHYMVSLQTYSGDEYHDEMLLRGDPLFSDYMIVMFLALISK